MHTYLFDLSVVIVTNGSALWIGLLSGYFAHVVGEFWSRNSGNCSRGLARSAARRWASSSAKHAFSPLSLPSLSL